MGPVVFSSPRFDMRPWERGDEVALHPILGDPRVVWWDADAGDLEHTRDVLERIVSASEGEPGQRGFFAVVRRGMDEPIGNVILRTPAVESDGLELGWHVAYDHWGGGIAPEAARATLAHGHATYREQTFVALIEPSNTASQRVAAKLGMRYEREVTYADSPHGLYRIDV